MSKEKFSKGHKVRVIKTDLHAIEIEHAKHVAGKTGAKRIPYVEIRHDADEDKYHITTRGRAGNNGFDHQGHSDDEMDQGEFTQHVVNLHRDHPKMQPFPKEARLKTHKNGFVDIHIAHPDYKKK